MSGWHINSNYTLKFQVVISTMSLAGIYIQYTIKVAHSLVWGPTHAFSDSPAYRHAGLVPP